MEEKCSGDSFFAIVIILISECDDLHWGENCQGSCTACGNVKECDKTQGCICEDGYRGDLCNQNINECNETNVSQNCTGLNEVCVDTIGSYVCQCLDGYERNDTDQCGKIIIRTILTKNTKYVLLKSSSVY